MKAAFVPYVCPYRQNVDIPQQSRCLGLICREQSRKFPVVHIMKDKSVALAANWWGRFYTIGLIETE
jgi:hypothetical protein